MEEVPVNVIAKPDPLENLLRMFNIHQLREQWNIIETAWKLEKIIKLSGVDNERRLAELTGISIGQIRRLKVILTFDKTYQNKIYDYLSKSGKGVKADFLIEMFPSIRKLEKEFPEFYTEHRYKLMDAFLKKYEDGVIKNVTDFRTFKKVLKNYEGVSKEKVERQLLEFLDTPTQSIYDLYEKTSKTYYKVDNAMALSGRLSSSLEELINTKNLQSDPDFIITLKVLDKRIKELLKKLV